MKWEPIIQSGVRKKKTHIYKESRKVALMNLFAGQQWRHIENRLVDTVEGEGGMNWESSMEKHTLSYVKLVAGGKLQT